MINWTRVIRRTATGALKKGTRWASQPYRDERRNQRLAKRRRKTWRSR